MTRKNSDSVRCNLFYLRILSSIVHISDNSILAHHSLGILTCPHGITSHVTLLQLWSTIPSAADGIVPAPGWLCARCPREVYHSDTTQVSVFVTSVHFHIGSGPLSRSSTRSPQLPHLFTGYAARSVVFVFFRPRLIWSLLWTTRVSNVPP